MVTLGINPKTLSQFANKSDAHARKDVIAPGLKQLNVLPPLILPQINFSAGIGMNPMSSLTLQLPNRPPEVTALKAAGLQNAGQGPAHSSSSPQFANQTDVFSEVMLRVQNQSKSNFIK